MGSTLPDNAELDVGKGEAVQVLMSGKTYSIAGPYKGTVANYQPCTGWRAVFGKCEQQSNDTEGGYTPGATRSFRIDNDAERGGTPAGSR
ncbi:MAG: hypothetical protein JSR78_08920 [Proteobacteria bacterium]|nr:hypothetical protein [Pseudomonadota bacterium]